MNYRNGVNQPNFQNLEEQVIVDMSNTDSKTNILPQTTIRNIKITERGWKAHFCGASHCQFNRNTLVEDGKIYIVVSTIGNYRPRGVTEKIGLFQYYETCCFFAEFDGTYWDANTKREISVDIDCYVQQMSRKADKIANEIHERCVAVIKNRITAGEFDRRKD